MRACGKRSARTATAVVQILIVLGCVAASAQETRSADGGDIVEDMETVLDGVSESLKEGETDVEAGRGFLERTLDFLKGLALGLYDIVAEQISDDGSLSYDQAQQFIVGMDYDQVLAILEIYGIELDSKQLPTGSLLLLAPLEDSDEPLNLSFVDGVLVATDDEASSGSSGNR